MRSVILLGYMCAGKSTIGRNLAKELNRQFYDLDWYIEERYHKRIPQIFEEKGEDGFRDLERRMLHEAAEFEDIVLACGGGTPCFFDNMDYMNGCAVTVFLKASTEIIKKHLQLSHTVRPLLQGKNEAELTEFIEKQMEERLPYYSCAQYTFNVNVLDNYSKIDQLVNHIKGVLLAQEDGKMEN